MHICFLHNIVVYEDEEIARRTTGVKGCYFLAGSLKVFNISRTCLQKVSIFSLVP